MRLAFPQIGTRRTRFLLLIPSNDLTSLVTSLHQWFERIQWAKNAVEGRCGLILHLLEGRLPFMFSSCFVSWFTLPLRSLMSEVLKRITVQVYRLIPNFWQILGVIVLRNYLSDLKLGINELFHFYFFWLKKIDLTLRFTRTSALVEFSKEPKKDGKRICWSPLMTLHLVHITFSCYSSWGYWACFCTIRERGEITPLHESLQYRACCFMPLTF